MGGSARAPWIDSRLQRQPERPWRKVHLDFHNTPAVGAVGDGFDADEFVATLKRGHVDSIVVFAKDMHGYFYYPASRGPVHPGLGRDLLGEQVAACRTAGIRVYAYYCVAWDNLVAEQHPEWLAFTRERRSYLPSFDETPGWTALCLTAEDFVAQVFADSREIIERYPIDGIWYDMPLPRDGECFCHRCLAALRAAGEDPADRAAQRRHKQALLVEFMRRSKELAQSIRPGIDVDQNNQTRTGLAERAPLISNIEIEALPTGGWGYQYYPVNARYSRTFGVPICGMTGRFNGHWADFGGLKQPRQLQVELAAIVAQGAQCSIGDQPGPSGRLDEAVYTTIGAAYGRIERLHPWLHNAAPVVEAAILVDALPLTDVGAITNGNHADGPRSVLADSVAGTARLLRDERIQFDVVDPTADLDRYRLLVLPDGLHVTAELAEQLRAYAGNGGAVIAAATAVAEAGGAEPWAKELPVELLGPSPYSVPYVVPGTGVDDAARSFEYALYGGAQRWRCADDAAARVFATLAEPAFERSPQHFTSHSHSPVATRTDLVVALAADRIGALAFPVGTVYRETGYWVYRSLFRAVLEAVLPDRLVRSTAASAAEISVTAQRTDDGTRYLVHVVNTSTDVRWGSQLERFEQDLPLHDVELVVDVPEAVRSARLAESGERLALERTDAGVRLVVPRVSVSEIVVLEP